MSNRGGFRQNAGRKPAAKKKKAVSVTLSLEAKTALTEIENNLSGTINKIGELLYYKRDSPLKRLIIDLTLERTSDEFER